MINVNTAAPNIPTEAERRAQLIAEMTSKIRQIEVTAARNGGLSMEDAILKREFSKRLIRLEAGDGLEPPTL